MPAWRNELEKTVPICPGRKQNLIRNSVSGYWIFQTRSAGYLPGCWISIGTKNRSLSLPPVRKPMLGKSIICDNFSFQLSLRRYFPQIGPFYPTSSAGRDMDNNHAFLQSAKGKILFSFFLSQKQVKTADPGRPHLLFADCRIRGKTSHLP